MQNVSVLDVESITSLGDFQFAGKIWEKTGKADKKTKKAKTFLSMDIAGNSFLAFRNIFKVEEKHPDWIINHKNENKQLEKVGAIWEREFGISINLCGKNLSGQEIVRGKDSNMFKYVVFASKKREAVEAAAK